MRPVLLVGGVALLVLLLWQLGPTEIVDAFTRTGWYLIPVFLVGGASQVMRAYALRQCILQPDALSYFDALGIRLSGEAVQSLTFTGPVLAQPTKAWLLEAHGLTLREGFAATLTEYLVNSFVSAAMSIAGLIYLLAHFSPPRAVIVTGISIVSLFGAFLVASAIAIARRFYLIGTVVAGLARAGILRGRMRPDMVWINRLEDLLLIVLRDSPRRFGVLVLLELAAEGLLVLELFWLMRVLEVETSLLLAFVIEAAVKVVGVAALFVPLQLGVAEGAYALVFDIIGLPAPAGFAIAFLLRVRTVAIASLGLATLAALTRRRQRHQA